VAETGHPGPQDPPPPYAYNFYNRIYEA